MAALTNKAEGLSQMRRPFPGVTGQRGVTHRTVYSVTAGRRGMDHKVVGRLLQKMVSSRSVSQDPGKPEIAMAMTVRPYHGVGCSICMF